ncbi:uncharacterized protein LOC122279830 isoform X2 [Carya illinoinensis]|uniref:PRC-barrel domain-containing protein n=1 Tax=Carya illinoinensis TaxID=32201 RepID=A0A8T1P8K6_CARIL|nr:uncharacterized protein LOC122279830 isoform X2 [Carya illinoinensis]KAG6640329.1 hypothetical protein CIPAW_10G165500 [Carya illinoinensis]
MCDCLPSSPLPFSLAKYRKSGLTTSAWRPQHEPIRYIHAWKSPRLAISRCGNPSKVFESEDYESYDKLGFKEKGENNSVSGEAASSAFDFLELKGAKGNTRSEESVEERDLLEVGEQINGRVAPRKGRQMVRRSNMVAKQVISIRSALSLGFVSELWVDITSWVVLFVQVRPNLLSGESETFLFEDISQVGDVILVKDESVMENEFKMIGLETLVGYKVVTPGRRNIGKVRGYSLNINSGAIESLELDSFGISIIPSSLVSTYALFVEDVLEVMTDAVVVHEAAASRIQRLTKGFLGTQNVGTSIDDLGEYPFERPPRSEESQGIKRNHSYQRFQEKNRATQDDWELPMDFL